MALDEKNINLFRRKKEILQDNKEYNSLIEEFSPYLFRLYEMQDNILLKKGGLLLEKEKETQAIASADKIRLLELFGDNIIFK